MRKSWMLALGLLFMAAMPAAAQQKPAAAPAAMAGPEVPMVCAQDVKKFCAGVRPGEGRMLECLRKNTDGLSPDCKPAIAAGRTNIPASPCKADIERLCPGVEPGEGRLAECLRKNAISLSASCRTYQVRIKD